MLVITGGSGVVGMQLIDQLRQDGTHQLLLVSRDPAAFRDRFPDCAVTDYAGLAAHDLNGASVLHLAARNNNVGGTAADFSAANVDHLLAVAAIAKRGGAAQFINFCSTHALAPKDGDLYGASKRDGAQALAQYWPDGALNLYLPAVYGARFSGKLGLLNGFSGPLRGLALALLGQIKPMVSVTRLADYLAVQTSGVTQVEGDSWRTEQYLADPVPARGLYAAGKRALDILAAIAIFVLLGWAMLLVAIYVRWDSKGPAIFAQERVGQNGHSFICYKFRTMGINTEQAATHNVSAASITRAGAFLRRTKLDELPQAVNLLKNEMSLVGPRPCLPVQTELVRLRQLRGVLAMKPGITGLAQVNDVDMSDPAKLAAWDSRYGAYRTLLLDCLLILRTMIGGGSGDRVVIPADAPPR